MPQNNHIRESRHLMSIFESETGATPDPAAKTVDVPIPIVDADVTVTNDPNASKSTTSTPIPTPTPTNNKNKNNRNNDKKSTSETKSEESSNNSRNKKAKGASKGLLPQNIQKMGENLGKDLTLMGDSLVQSASKLAEDYDVNVLSKVSNSTGIQFAPVKTPLFRRRQTLAVLLYTVAFFIAVGLNFWAWRGWTGIKFYLYLAYLTYKLMYQTFHKDGGLPVPWFRGSVFWKWFVDFFPVTLHKTCDLDKSGETSYIFGYHPHGIIGMGAWASFACCGQSGFSRLFPNVDVRLLTLRLNFLCAIF